LHTGKFFTVFLHIRSLCATPNFSRLFVSCRERVAQSIYVYR
jgi:hypothetical protein